MINFHDEARRSVARRERRNCDRKLRKRVTLLRRPQYIERDAVALEQLQERVGGETRRRGEGQR